MAEKRVKISLVLESFHNLEKAYSDLKKNLFLSEDEFVSNKLLQDKVRVDFNLAFESCMRVCRHLSVVYGLKTTSKDCLVRLAQFIGFQDVKGLSDFTDFYFKYRDLKESVSPQELYRFLSEKLMLFKEFAKAVVEFIKKDTNNPLLIDFDLLNEKARHVRDSVDKMKFVLSQGFDEFKNKPMYYDRVKYFYQVAYDSLFEICKHLAPKFGVKRFGDDCLSKLIEIGVIPQEYYMDVFKMTLLKNRLISTWEIPKEELFESIKELECKFEPIMKEISKSLRKLLEK